MSIKLKDTIYDLIDKAIKDSSGNTITDTYLNKTKSGTVSGDLTVNNLIINTGAGYSGLYRNEAITSSGSSDTMWLFTYKKLMICGEDGIEFNKIPKVGTTAISLEGHTHSEYLTSLPSHSHDYLPLSGGKINSSEVIPLYINSSTSGSGIHINLQLSNVNKAQIGYNNSLGFFIHNYTGNAYLGVADDGTPFYHKGSTRTLIHSGNIGSQSVNYATSSGSISGYTITSRTSPNYTDWQTVGSTSIVTEKFLSYWNGAHTSSGDSNLAYCIKGAFGTAATANKGDFATASHNHNYIISPYYYSSNVMTNSMTSSTIFGTDSNINKLSCGFMEGHPVWNDWADVLYWTGYCKWGGTQLAALYNSDKPRVAIRKFVQNSSVTDGGNWGSWTEFITSGNIGSQSVNYATSAGKASQLTTSRSIWGQSFNGTGNIAISTVGQMKYLLFTGTDNSTAVGYVGRGSDGNNNIYLTAYAASNLMLGTNNKDGIITINPDENVGVGTQSPVYKFDIKNTTSTDYDFHIFNSSTNSSFYVGKYALWYGTSSTSGEIFYINSGCTRDGGGGSQVFKVDAAGYTKAGSFNLSNTGYAYCGLMPNAAITNGGNAKDIWLYNENLVSIYGGTGITLKSDSFLYGKFYFDQPSTARDRGIIGSYDPNRAAAIWSMGSAYQIKSDGTTFGNLYGAAYVYYGSGYTFGAGKSEGHSLVWCQAGIPYAALGNYIWSVYGFKKEGSSDAYVLLGGGGHKALSDFSTGQSVTYAANSTYLYASDSPYRYGDTAPYYMRIRYNVNSDNRWYLSMYPETPKTISVDYAYHAGSVAWGNVSGKPSSFTPSSHTHSYAGSSSAGGAATSANKLNTNAGSTTKPVYFSGGVPVQVTGCMVQYWAIYEVYFSPSGTSGSIITKKAGNHNFCSSISSREALGQIIVNTSYPSGFDESTTMIFGVGDHAENNHIDSVYITVNKQYGSGTQMRLILADDDRQNWGYAHLYFLCIG